MAAAIALACVFAAAACNDSGGTAATTRATTETTAKASAEATAKQAADETTTTATTAEATTEATIEETTEAEATTEETAEEATEAEATAEETTEEAATMEDTDAAGDTDQAITAETSPGKLSASQAESPDALSNDLYSFQFALDGAIYELPTPYSQFKENGWTGDNLDVLTLPPNQRNLITYLTNGVHRISVEFVNTSEDALTFDKCDVGGITIYKTRDTQGLEFILPKGVTNDSSYLDVLAAYGDPTEKYESEYLTRTAYMIDTYAQVKIEFDAETKTVDEIEVVNLIRKEISPEFEGETPDNVAAYKPPDKLGDSWDGFAVKYAGNYYYIPAPVAAFVENGWAIDSDPNEMVPAQKYKIGVNLRKYNQTLRTNVQNYSNTEQPVINCFVTTVMTSIYTSPLTLELPKGITGESSIEDVVAAYGKPDSDNHDSDMFDYYNYGDNWSGVTFVMNKDENVMYKIEVYNEPKVLPKR
jgi:hypothetical protein